MSLKKTNKPSPIWAAPARKVAISFTTPSIRVCISKRTLISIGKKNSLKTPTVDTPNGEISETLMSGTLREHYMTDHREY